MFCLCAEKANFELTNRVPLIIRAPAFAASAGKRTTVFYDHVDLYPTLAELAGLPSPQPAIGTELSPLALRLPCR